MHRMNQNQRRITYAGHLRETAIFKRFHQLPDIQSIGKMILDPVWARKMHKSGSNELMHVIRGNVAVRLGKSRFEAGPGDTLLIPVGTMHRDEFDLSIGLEAFYIFFKWPPCKDYFRIVPLNAVTRLCAPEAVEIGKLCDRMQSGLDRGTAADQLVIAAYTHTILLLILREALRSRQRHNTDEHLRHGQILLLQAREYIDMHYTEQISLDQIADKLRISTFYLSHLFSRESNFSLVEYVTSIRMQKAKAMLAAGGKNVAEAAYAVGYNDSNYFSKVFHRHFGVSPHSVRCDTSGETRGENSPRNIPLRPATADCGGTGAGTEHKSKIEGGKPSATGHSGVGEQ